MDISNNSLVSLPHDVFSNLRNLNSLYPPPFTITIAFIIIMIMTLFIWTWNPTELQKYRVVYLTTTSISTHSSFHSKFTSHHSSPIVTLDSNRPVLKWHNINSTQHIFQTQQSRLSVSLLQQHNGDDNYENYSTYDRNLSLNSLVYLDLVNTTPSTMFVIHCSSSIVPSLFACFIYHGDNYRDLKMNYLVIMRHDKHVIDNEVLNMTLFVPSS